MIYDYLYHMILNSHLSVTHLAKYIFKNVIGCKLNAHKTLARLILKFIYTALRTENKNAAKATIRSNFCVKIFKKINRSTQKNYYIQNKS